MACSWKGNELLMHTVHTVIRQLNVLNLHGICFLFRDFFSSSFFFFFFIFLFRKRKWNSFISWFGFSSMERKYSYIGSLKMKEYILGNKLHERYYYNRQNNTKNQTNAYTLHTYLVWRKSFKKMKQKNEQKKTLHTHSVCSCIDSEPIWFHSWMKWRRNGILRAEKERERA